MKHFETASLAANRAARCLCGCAIRKQYARSSSVNTRARNRSPWRSSALADPGDLDHVGAEADQDAAGGQLDAHGFIRAFISRTASSIPVKSARLRMLWPMFSSCRCGRVLTSAMFT